jgi:hypothetical protein
MYAKKHKRLKTSVLPNPDEVAVADVLLDECRSRRYRRYKGELYKPKYVNIDGETVYTFYFIHDMTIDQFVEQSLRRSDISLSTSQATKSCKLQFGTDYLTHCDVLRLPELTPNRLFFSYRNGIFDAKQNLFYTFIPTEENLTPRDMFPDALEPKKMSTLILDQNLTTTNFIDQQFDFRAYRECVPCPLKDDPLNIPTPTVQRILDDQKLSPDVCRWFYAMCGRMIYPVNYLDTWEVQPMTKGIPDTGKSILWNLVCTFFNSQDVGYITRSYQKSEYDPTNPSSDLLDVHKKLFVCFDFKNDPNLSPMVAAEMASGGLVEVTKGKSYPYMDVEWTAPVAFTGNCLPSGYDMLKRRLMIFHFNEVVAKTDPHLSEMMKLELPAFMKKCVTAYRQKIQFVEEFGGPWRLWMRLPVYFHETWRVIQKEAQLGRLRTEVMHCETQLGRRRTEVMQGAASRRCNQSCKKLKLGWLRLQELNYDQ